MNNKEFNELMAKAEAAESKYAQQMQGAFMLLIVDERKRTEAALRNCRALQELNDSIRGQLKMEEMVVERLHRRIKIEIEKQKSISLTTNDYNELQLLRADDQIKDIAISTLQDLLCEANEEAIRLHVCIKELRDNPMMTRTFISGTKERIPPTPPATDPDAPVAGNEAHLHRDCSNGEVKISLTEEGLGKAYRVTISHPDKRAFSFTSCTKEQAEMLYLALKSFIKSEYFVKFSS